MNETQFDALIKRFGTTRLTRTSVLRGLVGGVAAVLTGVTLATDRTDVAARKRKRTICHCPDTNPNNCTTLRLKRKEASSHLASHPNDYKGACQKPGKAPKPPKGSKPPKAPPPSCTAEQCAAIGQVCCTSGKQAGTCQLSLEACGKAKKPKEPK